MDSQLSSIYDHGTFGVSRRTFVKLAAACGVTAMGGMLAFPGQHADAAFTEPEDPSWPELPAGKVRFTVHSDTHFTCCDVEKKLPFAFETIYQAVPDCAAHVFAGDSVNTGTTAEFDALLAGANAAIRKPALFVMGNHEFGVGGSPLEGNAVTNFKYFLSHLTCADAYQKPGGAFEGKLNVHTEIGGYHVIAASCGRGYWYGDTTYDDDGTTPITILDWMKREIAAAAADDPTGTKPIFFMTHHPFPDTVWYSPTSFNAGWIGDYGSVDDRNSKAFYNELKAKYPQLVHFSGHTHIPEEDPRSIFQDVDGFTLVQTATFGDSFWMRGGKDADGYDENGGTGGHPSDGYDASQCLLVEVDAANGHEVTIRRMDFRQGAYLGTPWTFKVSDKSTWTYTHAAMEARSLPPILEEGAAVRIPADSITQTGASFAIAADKIRPDTSGLSDDVVMSYRIVVLDAQGAEVYNACYMSDYYNAPANQPAEFVRPLFGAALAPESPYSLKAYARNPWEKETLIGEVIFTTAGGEAVPATPLLSVDFSQGSAADLSETPHVLTPFGSPAFETVEEFGRQVAAEDFAKLATSTTAELLVQFTAKPSSGYTDIFSCGQGGGQWLEYYPTGKLHYYFTDGSTNVSTPVEPGVWTHITATYDGASLKIYQDGVLAGETAAAGEGALVHRSRLRRGGRAPGVQRRKGGVRKADAWHRGDCRGGGRELPGLRPVDHRAAGAGCLRRTRGRRSLRHTRGRGHEAVPSVIDPEGNPVGLYLTSVPEGAAALAAAAARGTTLYSFVPTVDGNHTVTYRAGYSQASLTVSVAAAPIDPDPEPTPDPQPTPDPTPDPDPAPGNGAGGGTGSSGQGTGGSGTAPGSTGGSRLAKTGDGIEAGGALVGLMATAGAAICVARSFWKGEFSEEESR